jgi:hypothetical protein
MIGMALGGCIMRIVGILVAAAPLLACATAAPPADPFVWVRTDGQGFSDNPAFSQQWDTDRVICEGEMQKANLSGVSICRGAIDCIAASAARGESMSTVGRGCMAQRGWVLVHQSEAASYLATARAGATKAGSTRR